MVYAPVNHHVPFLNWTAVNFAANISDVNLFELYYKGLFGGFNAYYYTLSLHDIIRDYAGTETRDIRFFPIKLTNREYERFLSNLKATEDIPEPYLFFSNNCAHGIYQILYESLDDLPTKPMRVMSPLSVVSILNTKNRLENPFILYSAKTRILNYVDKERAELEFMEWQNQQGFFQFNIDRNQRMSQLRISLSQKDVGQPQMFVPDVPWTDPHKYSRLETGISYTERNISTYFNYRPLLHDPSDNQHFYSGFSTIQLLSPTIVLQESKIYLRSVDILHLRSTPIFDKWFRSISYDVFLGYDDRAYNASVGIGMSFYLSRKKSITMEFLLLDSLKNGVNFVGIETQILKNTTGKIRYGLSYEHLYKGFSSDMYLNLTSWMAFDISKNYGFYLENVLNNHEKGNTKAGVRYYF